MSILAKTEIDFFLMRIILGWIFRIGFSLLLGFILLSILLVLVYRFLPPPITTLMVIRSSQQAIADDREIRLKKEWTPLRDISKDMVRAAIASEDQNFEVHNGFDFDAIEKARAYNKKNKGKRTRGASTITQQLAKNLFLWPGRTWFRKGAEAWFTVLVELVWDKRRIMEVYLNVIEFGDGIYGVQAASNHYFSKDAKNLSKEQASLLIACLPSPLKWSPVRPSRFVKWKKNWILRQMSLAGSPSFLE
jgi:monofunctional biosynthetic peptidoglycan transglycosylase